MKRNRTFSKLSIVAFGMLIGLAILLPSPTSGQQASVNQVGVPDDWSHHHLIFSNPGTFADAMKNGTFLEWYKTVNDPRFQMQQMKRNLASSAGFSPEMTTALGARVSPDGHKAPPPPPPPPNPIHRDWSMDIGGVSASQTGTFTANVRASGNVTINNNGTNTLTLTPSGTGASVVGDFVSFPPQDNPITLGSLTLTAASGTNVVCGGATSTTYGEKHNAADTAGYFAATINSCNSLYSVPFTAAQCPCASVPGSTTSYVLVTGTTPGSDQTISPLGSTDSAFSWGSVTAGTDGSNTCSSSTTGGFAISNTPSTEATNLAAAIHACTNKTTTGVDSTSTGNPVTVTATSPGNGGNSITLGETLTGFAWTSGATSLAGGVTATVGADQYPAKYPFSTTSAACTDFVVYNAGVPGTSSQPSIVAYSNLYSTGCTAPVPSVYWAYNTGDTIPTSVALSSDGSQVAFVDSAANLVLLKWKANNGTLASPVTPNLASSAANYYSGTGCANPCMYKIALSGATSDTNSPPWYVYGPDILFVGDDQGVLHKFTGVFLGTPAEVTGGGTGSGWPQTISVGNKLTGPVYDNVQTYDVFVGSSAGTLSYIPNGGGSSNIVTSSTLITSGSTGIVDSPIVDPVAKRAYVFVNDDTGGHAGVFQFATNFSGSTSGTEETLGAGALTGNAYVGTPDNIYLSSNNGANPVGNLYVCGRATGSQIPTLWRVPIGGTGSTLSAAVVGPALATAATDCSPVTEFFNSPTDSIFLSVEANNQTSSPISCPSGSGCIMSFSVTTTSGWGASKATSGTLAEAGGTSGVIIDNSATSPAGTSQVYFSPLGSNTCGGNGSTGSGTGGCATQAAQSPL